MKPSVRDQIMDTLYEDEGAFECPTEADLEQKLAKMVKTGLDENQSLVILAEFLTNYSGFMENPEEVFSFLDKHDFDYNSEGNYSGDECNHYLAMWASEYRHLDMLSELAIRGASMDILQRNLGTIDTLIIGHNSCQPDYSAELEFLYANGGLLNLSPDQMEGMVNFRDLHPAVAEVLVSHGYDLPGTIDDGVWHCPKPAATPRVPHHETCECGCNDPCEEEGEEHACAYCQNSCSGCETISPCVNDKMCEMCEEHLWVRNSVCGSCRRFHPVDEDLECSSHKTGIPIPHEIIVELTRQTDESCLKKYLESIKN